MSFCGFFSSTSTAAPRSSGGLSNVISTFESCVFASFCQNISASSTRSTPMRSTLTILMVWTIESFGKLRWTQVWISSAVMSAGGFGRLGEGRSGQHADTAWEAASETTSEWTSAAHHHTTESPDRGLTPAGGRRQRRRMKWGRTGAIVALLAAAGAGGQAALPASPPGLGAGAARRPARGASGGADGGAHGAAALRRLAEGTGRGPRVVLAAAREGLGAVDPAGPAEGVPSGDHRAVDRRAERRSRGRGATSEDRLPRRGLPARVSRRRRHAHHDLAARPELREHARARLGLLGAARARRRAHARALRHQGLREPGRARLPRRTGSPGRTCPRGSRTPANGSTRTASWRP